MPEQQVKYDQMQLHDGCEDAKNDTLSELLEPMRAHGMTDWEGEQDGIHISLYVAEGDTIQVSKDGWIRVVRQTRMPDMTFTEKDM